MSSHDFHTKSNTLKTLEEINRKISDNSLYADWAEPLTQYEYAIQGKMFMASYQASEHQIVSMGEDAFKQRVKESLAMDLVNKMLEAGVIEFTQMQDQITLSKLIKARCYLVPDNQVRLLRTLYKDK